LVGCPRSGTTLLQQLLDAHPEVAIAPETHFIRRFVKPERSFGDLDRGENYRRLIESIVAMPEFMEMDLDAAAFREAAEREPRGSSFLFRLLLRQFAARRGARLVGEKTPNHLLYMQTMERIFPEARFVHIVRDPRAVVSSWKTIPWSTGSVAGDSEVWRRYMETARRRPPSSITTITYERLVTDTDGVLRNVCAYLGLALHPAMLEHHTRTGDGMNLRREPWKTEAASPIATAPIARWRNELSADDLRTIESIAWFEMRRLGYRPETGTLSGLHAAAVALVRRKVARWRRRRAKRRNARAA
jgi:hypothetical protein